jgi:hypothetical protein
MLFCLSFTRIALFHALFGGAAMHVHATVDQVFKQRFQSAPAPFV